MPAYTNIQELFRSIQSDQVANYLTRKGWNVCPSDPAVRQFEGPFGDDGELVRQWFWASESHPKFRHRLPNVIFALSILEKREALTIANEIFAASTAPLAAGEAVFRLRNQRSAILAVTTGDSRRLIDLRPGEGLEIRGTRDDVVLEWRDEGLQVARCLAPARVAFLAREAEPPGLAEALLGELQLAADERAAAAEALSPLLSRLAFELTEQSLADTSGRNWLRRQAALLAASAARHVAPESPGPDNLWRLIARWLRRGDWRLALVVDAAEAMYDVASHDDPAAPTATVEWLKSHTC